VTDISQLDPASFPLPNPAAVDPWRGTFLEALYGGAAAPRCAIEACRRPFSQQEHRAGADLCEHCALEIEDGSPEGIL
jgi:hypothetical protein